MRIRDSKPKTAVILFDVDGCFYDGIEKKPAHQSIEEWLIQKNKPILDDLIKKLRAQGYKRVILGYGTNRQSDSTDLTNGYTCTPILPIFQSYMQSQLEDCDVVMDSFWMADIYANKRNGGIKKAGESYQLALKGHFGDEEPKVEAHSQEVFDADKSTLLYAHAHRASVLTRSPFDLFFIDDKTSILKSLHDFSTEYKSYLPNCTINFIEYAGKGVGTPFKKPIICKGPTDKNYDWGVRYIWSKNHVGGTDSDREIKTAEELKKAHEEDHYFEHRDRITPLGQNSCMDMRDLHTFRDIESSKLTSTLGDLYYGDQAEDLVKKRLIPRSFLVGKPLLDEEKSMVKARIRKKKAVYYLFKKEVKENNEDKVISIKPEYQLKQGEKRIVLGSEHWFSDLKNLPPNIAIKLINTIKHEPVHTVNEFKYNNCQGTRNGYPLWALEMIVPADSIIENLDDWRKQDTIKMRSMGPENLYRVYLVKSDASMLRHYVVSEKELDMMEAGIDHPGFIPPSERLKIMQVASIKESKQEDRSAGLTNTSFPFMQKMAATNKKRKKRKLEPTSTLGTKP